MVMADEELPQTPSVSERQFALPSWTPKTTSGKEGGESSSADELKRTPTTGPIKIALPVPRQTSLIPASARDTKNAHQSSGILPWMVAFLALIVAGHLALTLYLAQPKAASETETPAVPAINPEEVRQLKDDLTKTRQQLTQAQQEITRLQGQMSTLNGRIASIPVQAPPLDYPWLKGDKDAPKPSPKPADAPKTENKPEGIVK